MAIPDKNRIFSIDLLRGLVMIIMALDHTRDFFHFDTFLHNPLDLATTSPYLYFTRWVTHFCAPIFVFLAGTSAFLQSFRKSKKELSIFLIKRGVWLMLVEIFIVNLIVTFDVTYGLTALQTIWAIGASMFILGLAIWLPFPAILALGLIIVFGHNYLDFIEAGHQGPFGFWWDLLHRGNFAVYNAFGNHSFLIIYAFVPWSGLMMLGYCFGKLFRADVEASRRRKILISAGTAIILFFVLLRAVNFYGDPHKWFHQPNSLFTFLSFMNVHKYPPSLLFMCITIGPAILFLALFEKTKNRFTEFVTIYGRVPFLFYILHFFLIHLLATIIFFMRGHDAAEGNNEWGLKFLVPGEGYSLSIVYLIWIGVVLSLFPVCKWFSEYKMRSKKWWLSYL